MASAGVWSAKIMLCDFARNRADIDLLKASCGVRSRQVALSDNATCPAELNGTRWSETPAE